jgi:hypothetical protein
MNDDRFNFDDDMPDWLQDDDDHLQDDSDQPQQAADSVPLADWDISDLPEDSSSSSSTPPSLGVTGELPWRQEASDPTAPSSSRSSIDELDWDGLDSSDDDGDQFATNAVPETSLDWLTDDRVDSATFSAAETEGASEVPDWLSGPDDFGSFDEPSDAEFDAPIEASTGNVPDWLDGSTDFNNYDVVGASESMPESDYGAGGELDLDDFDSMFDETPQAQTEIPERDDSADWLFDEPVAETQAADDEDVDLLDFLFDDDFPEGDDEAAADSEPSGVIRRLSDAAPPPEPEQPPPLRRLSDVPAQQQPPPPEEPRRIRKLSEAGKPVDSGELTFEEWERQQSQAQFEEEHAEELAIDAEVPDWFQDNVKIGDAADEIASLLIPEEDLPDAPPQSEEGTGGPGGDYVPEWFMGLEEQNLDEAPDWVRDAASGTDALANLVDSSAFAPPEPEAPVVPEAPAVEMEGDVPDWFAGVDAGLGLGDTAGDDADWMASFSTPPADAQPSSMADFDLPDLSASPESASVDESDWMADMNLPDAAPVAVEAADDAELGSLFDDDFDMDFGDEPDLVSLESSASDQPDWMADISRPATDSSPPPQIPVSSTPEIDADSPSWLQGYEAPANAAEEEDLFADQQIDSGMEWLDDVASVDFSDAFAAGIDDDPFEQLQGTKKPTTDELISSVDVSNLDDLLGMTGAESSLVPARAGADSDDFFSSTDGMDDLFDGVDESLFESFSESAPPAASMATSDAPADEGDMVYEAEGPDWVHELRPDLQVKLNVGGLNVEFDQQGVNQLPESLQNLRDQARSVVQNAPKESDEALYAQGPLAGITGGLSISPVTTVVQSELELTTQTTIPGYQAQQIDVLEQALAIAYEAETVLDEPDFDDLEDEAPAPKAARTVKKQRVKRKLDRFFISIILLAAMIGPFATEALHIAEEPDTTAMAAEQQVVISGVAALEPGDYVLLAFEYGPTAAGELNPLAEAVLRDIFSQRAIPIIISTNPLGALNGRGVLEKLAADEDLLNVLERDDSLVAGEDYYALRYISGGAVAIRSLSHSETLSAFVFSTDNTGEETGLDFGRLDAEDFALTFVIGESIEDVRNWAEQFDVPDLLKFTLVTASTEPLVRAYVDADGTSAFWGYLAGYRDTYRYNRLRNQRTLPDFEAPDDIDIPDPDISQWHSMAVGALVAGLLIILGMVFNTLRNTRRRRRV